MSKTICPNCNAINSGTASTCHLCHKSLSEMYVLYGISNSTNVLEGTHVTLKPNDSSHIAEKFYKADSSVTVRKGSFVDPLADYIEKLEERISKMEKELEDLKITGSHK
jgi:hypothetical protein